MTLLTFGAFVLFLLVILFLLCLCVWIFAVILFGCCENVGEFVKFLVGEGGILNFFLNFFWWFLFGDFVAILFGC